VLLWPVIKKKKQSQPNKFDHLETQDEQLGSYGSSMQIQSNDRTEDEHSALNSLEGFEDN
jgi:hypothetical protein